MSESKNDSGPLELYLGVLMDPIGVQVSQQGFVWGSSELLLDNMQRIADNAVELKVGGYLTDAEFRRIGQRLANNVAKRCLRSIGQLKETSTP